MTTLNTLRDILSGGAVANKHFARRVPILLFGALLMMIYIAIGFKIQKRYSQIEILSSEIKELRTTAIASSALRLELTRRENIMKQLEKNNIKLKEPTIKPIVIK